MQVKVGTAEVEPGWLDLQASVGKTISLFQGAGEQGVPIF